MISLINVPCDSPAEYYQPSPTHVLTVSQPKLRSSLSSPQLVRTQRDVARRAIKSSMSFNRAAVSTYDLPMLKQQRSASQEWMTIFERRHAIKRINYLGDGRKMLNGQLVENSSSSKLWEQLLLRSLAHKMEDKIESPIRNNEFFPPIDGQVSCLAGKSAVRSLRAGCILAVLTKILQGVQKHATTMGKRQVSLIGKYLRYLNNYRPFTTHASYSPVHAQNGKNHT